MVKQRWLLLTLSAVLLVGWFSPEISNSDFWWQLKTGQFIVEKHVLPVPDPFAYTTGAAGAAYAGEERTRLFNLTHEWLAQVLFYVVYRASGFGGIVAFRALLLCLLCGLVGWMAYRRCGGFYRGLAAAFASAGVVSGFAVDRPFLITYVLLAGTILILESRRAVWLLVPVFLIWANCHGGYFLGWVALGAYSAEAVVLRLRGKKSEGDRTLWMASAAAVVVSAINPNGLRIFQVLADYRSSYLTSRLLEWAPPALWPPTWYSVLLIAAAAVLVWKRRQVRIADWLIFAAFAGAALMASRNVILIAIAAPVVLASYLPEWRRPIPAFAPVAALIIMAGAVLLGMWRGSFFQFRANQWKWPSGAADFLLAHGVTQPIFNTYEYGGYLIWRLWPQERVFIDGRALSESVFLDYARILYNHDASDGKSADELLDQYGVQVIVMNGFEYATGNVYMLAPALADPHQTAWKLVYSDSAALVFMRHPAPDMQTLPSLAVLDHLEAECGAHIEHEPEYPRCARSLGQVFSKIGDFTRARRWIGIYLAGPHGPDPEAEDAYRRLLTSGR